ncbi:MAG: hypothetical protein ACTSQJ_00510 [Promethearchaeota archaeon]
MVRYFYCLGCYDYREISELVEIDYLSYCTSCRPVPEIKNADKSERKIIETKYGHTIYEDQYDNYLKRLKQINNQNRVKAAKKAYKTSELRVQNIIRSLNSKGYFSFDVVQIRDMIRNKFDDDEIIETIVNSFSDECGIDSDMLEVDYDKQFREHLEFIKKRYRNNENFEVLN